MKSEKTIKIENDESDKAFLFYMPKKFDLALTVLSQKLSLAQNKQISKSALCREAIQHFLSQQDVQSIIGDQIG